MCRHSKIQQQLCCGSKYSAAANKIKGFLTFFLVRAIVGGRVFSARRICLLSLYSLEMTYCLAIRLDAAFDIGAQQENRALPTATFLVSLTGGQANPSLKATQA